MRFLTLLCWAAMLVTSTVATAAPVFQRELDTIPVSVDGELLAQPWVGGLLGPRPQFADLDADGDQDLVIVQRGGGMSLYRNDGGPTSFDFVFVQDDLAGLDVGLWATFADIDNDGDLDLFCDGTGAVRFFRNDAGPGSLVWTLADSDWQSIDNTGLGNTPSFVDVDADGDLDYLEMEPNFGTARLFRNDGTPESPNMVFVTNTWACINTFDPGDGRPAHGASPISSSPGAFSIDTGSSQAIDAGGRHGISQIAAVDIDADSDLDVFIGDLFNESLWFFRDDTVGPEPCFSLVAQEYITPFTTGLNLPVFADLDGDADYDMLVGVANQAAGIDNLMFFRNKGTPTSPSHSAETLNFLPTLDLKSGSRPATADIDADGDQDLLVGASDGQVYHLENIGSPANPAFELLGPLEDAAKQVIDLGFWAAPELIDFDGDGDQDLLIGSGQGDVVYYRNVGTPTNPAFMLVDPQFTGVSGDFNATPAFADIDADGDFDAFIGEFGSALTPRIFFVRNDGTNQAPVWTLVSDNRSDIFAERVFVHNTAPELLDCDEDGDLDLFVGESEGNINFYQNDGSASQFSFTLVDENFGGVNVGRISAPQFVNLDGDQDTDLVVGEEGGGLNLYRNTTSVPVELSRFEALVAGNTVELTWVVQEAIDLWGFHVWRRGADVASDPTEPGEQLTRAPLTESPYRWVDRSVPPGRYLYTLQEVTTQGGQAPVGQRFAEVLPAVAGGFSLVPLADFAASGRAEFRVVLPAAGSMAARIYDASGRAVWHASAADLPAGAHTLVWDGQLKSGRAAAAGVYWLRVQVGGGGATARIVVVR